MTRQEEHSARLARALVKALVNLWNYDGDPQDILDDAKVLLSGEKKTFPKIEEAKEMIYYLECRLTRDDPYGGRA